MKLKFFIDIFKNLREIIINNVYEKSVFHFLQEVRKTYSEHTSSDMLIEFKIFPNTPKRLYPSIIYKNNVSVIIEGEIQNKNFIQGTINWYRNCGIKNIILSTNSFSKKFLHCKTISKFEIKPKGIWNENNKLENIKNALFHIDDEDLVIITRTDQRIYNEIFLTNIVAFHENQQLNKKNPISKMGVISTNSSILKINNISDHLYIDYGYKLKNMFNLNYRNGAELLAEINSYSKSKYNINKFRKQLISSLFPELECGQWFLNSYRRNCLEMDKSEKFFLEKEDYIPCLKKYLNFIKDSIYVIDPDDIQLYWLKININKNSFDSYDMFKKKNPIFFRDLTRLNWLCLINDKNLLLQIIKNANEFSFDDFIF